MPYLPPFELQVPWIPEGGEGNDDPESGEASDVAHGPTLERRRPDMSAATLTTFVARPSAGERDSRPGLGAEPVFGCGQIHEEPCCQPFKLLFAAFAGCRECVRASVEREHVDPAMLLLRGECNVLAWAVWGAAEGHDTAWVQGYLAGKGAAPRTRSSVTILGATGSGISCGFSRTIFASRTSSSRRRMMAVESVFVRTSRTTWRTLESNHSPEGTRCLGRSGGRQTKRTRAGCKVTWRRWGS